MGFSKPRKPTYRKMDVEAWQRSVAFHTQAMLKEAASWHPVLKGNKKKLESYMKRADSLRRCGTVIQTLKCGDCGHVNQAGATIVPFSCNMKTCLRCANRQRLETEEMFRFISTSPDFEEIDGYKWQFIVLCTDGERDLKSTRKLGLDMLRAAGKFWNRASKRHPISKVKLKEKPSLVAAIEIGNRGMIHLNMLFYGPVWHEKDLYNFFFHAMSMKGHLMHAWSKILDGGSEEMGRVASYVTKGVPLPVRPPRTLEATEWYRHHFLVERGTAYQAAKFSVAFLGTQTIKWYGGFRGFRKKYREFAERKKKFDEMNTSSRSNSEDGNGTDGSGSCRIDYCEHCGSKNVDFVYGYASQILDASLRKTMERKEMIASLGKPVF